MDKELTCVLCKKKFVGWGCNPEPLADEGVCCDVCDQTKVTPARLEFAAKAQAMARGIRRARKIVPFHRPLGTRPPCT